MTTMSHRERVVKALNHEETDRVPLDFGGTSTTTIDIRAYDRLTQYLGLEEKTQASIDPFYKRLGMASVSEAVIRRFDVDVRSLALGNPEVVAEVRLSDTSYRDEWGVTWEKLSDGHYMNKSGPFQTYEPTLADLERYTWPEPRDPGRIKGVKEQATQIRRETDHAIAISFPYGVVSACQRLRGFTEWMEDLVLNPALAEGFLDHVLRVCAGIAEYVLEEVGEYVDVFLFPDDLGFQDRPYMRPELYREKVKPYHRGFVDAVKRNTKAKALLHSDGAIYPLIPDLIDIGVDVLNPVQVSAAGMDSQRLKAEFGGNLSFWGGIDTQHVLPWGTPEEVRSEVRTRIEHLAPGGGYVLGSVHNIQAEVPPENITAMFDSALEHGRR